MPKPITIETRVAAPPETAWRVFTDPDAIMRWNFAAPDWCCPRAEVDLRPGGRHVARMEARDGSMGFDFEGTYEEVEPHRAITLRLDDGRRARTTFTSDSDGTQVQTVFDPEAMNPLEMQRDGWQAILDSYAAHVAKESA